MYIESTRTFVCIAYVHLRSTRRSSDDTYVYMYQVMYVHMIVDLDSSTKDHKKTTVDVGRSTCN